MNENHITTNSYVSSNDRDKRCNYYLCDVCIIPCAKCYNSHCEQCRFGYKNIVEKLIEKYSEEELAIHKNTCIYADMAFDELS